MSDMKRISGSGKTPYVWKDAPKRPARQTRPVRRSQAYKKQKSSLLSEKSCRALVALALVATVVISIVSISNLSAEKSRLQSMKRRQQELTESIEAGNITFRIDTRPLAIKQQAEKRLYMSYPEQSVALYTDARYGDNQTAGR